MPKAPATPREKKKQPITPAKAVPADRPILEFKTQAEWRTWLKKHHAIHTGIWLRFYKKGSGIPTVYYPEALDEALCHGWIDGQARSLDEASYLQRFTPRRPKGLWSKIKIGHIERLTREGKMMPRGIQEVEAAQKDGRWDAAYAGQRDAKVPEDFLKRLAKDKKAFAFFNTLSRQNHFAVYFRLTTAKKPETRERRMTVILETLARGEKLA